VRAIVFDAEADGFLEEATVVWCISTWEVGTGERKHFGPAEIEKGLEYLSSADELIGHNILNYDIPLFQKLHGWVPEATCILTDTVVRSRLFRSDRPLPSGCPGNVGPHSLEAWGYRVGKGKPSHDDWSQYTPEMKVRCDDDTEINVLTHHQLLKEEKLLPHTDWTNSLRIEHAIAPIITEQELNGCPLDLPMVFSTWLELENKIRKIDEVLVPLIPQVALPKSKQGTWPKQQYKKNGEPTVNALRYYGEDFGTQKEYRTDLIVRTAPINLNSNGQVKDYLLTLGWVPTEWNYKKDKHTKRYVRDGFGEKVKTSPKLTLDSLESCTFPEEHEEMGEQIVDRLMMAHRRGVLRGWMRDVRSDGRITAGAIPMGTPTGRMVHRGLVNVPRNTSPYGKELRSCATTVEGKDRVGIDLASCQLRGLAHYMRDEEFREQVVNGSPHEYSADMAGLEGDAKTGKKDKGKKLNYSVLFGAQAPKIAADLGMTIAEGKATIARFFKNLPKLDALMKYLKKEWKTKGYLVGLDGRAVWVRSEHMLLVYLMQVLESVVIKEFIISLYNKAKETGLDYELVTSMHDECQWLVAKPHVDLFCTLAHEAIDEINIKYNLWCPQAIDINIGSTWAECH
jgi:DNA polymerase I-like protein with 3'-5' exonuclease and polymerase domains